MSEGYRKRGDDKVENGVVIGLCYLRRGNPLDCLL